MQDFPHKDSKQSILVVTYEGLDVVNSVSCYKPSACISSSFPSLESKFDCIFFFFF